MLSHTDRKLFELIESDMICEFSELFTSGQNTNKFAENSIGQTFLGMAIEKKSCKITEFLIDTPGLLEKKDGHGRKPLMYLSRHFDHKMITLLLMKGVDINQDIGLGRNLLHLAATKKDKKIFDMLVSLGVDQNKKCDRGETPHDTLRRYAESSSFEYKFGER